MTQSYNLYQVVALRDKLIEGLMAHIGTKPEGSEFEKLVDDLYPLLPEDLKYGVVQESVTCLLGKEITKTLLADTMWRLAGNMDKLKLHKVVYPWSSIPELEWMPVQILSANRTLTWKGEAGYNYKLRVLAGSACPVVFWKTWPSKACSYVAGKLGFSAPWKNNPYHDGHELVSMRFMAEIDPKLCRDQLPGFEKIDCPSALKNWNRDILKARAHIKPPCPFDFTHYCYQCPVGYDQCKAGTHPKTYVLALCAICNAQTWHDPGANNVCVSCRDTVRRES